MDVCQCTHLAVRRCVFPGVALGEVVAVVLAAVEGVLVLDVHVKRSQPPPFGEVQMRRGLVVTLAGVGTFEPVRMHEDVVRVAGLRECGEAMVADGLLGVGQGAQQAPETHRHVHPEWWWGVPRRCLAPCSCMKRRCPAAAAESGRRSLSAVAGETH